MEAEQAGHVCQGWPMINSRGIGARRLSKQDKRAGTRRERVSDFDSSLRDPRRHLRSPFVQPWISHLSNVNSASYRASPLNWDFPFADSKVTIVPDFGPISKPKDHADDKCLFLSAKSIHFLLQECCGGRLRTKRRSSNRLLVEIVMFFAYRDTQPRCTNGGGTPNR